MEHLKDQYKKMGEMLMHHSKNLSKLET